MIRTTLIAAAASLIACPASAEPILAEGDRFEAAVSATQMSRLAIEGEKIAAVRKVEDPDGPTMMLEPEAATGDAYVAFDGDVAGRSFTAFLVTQSGRTVQALLRPSPGEGRTVLVRLAGPESAPAPQGPAGTRVSEGPRAERSHAYTDAIAAFVRLMFAGEAPAGVERARARGAVRRAGPFELKEVEAWSVMDLRGRVIEVANLTDAPQRLAAETLVVPGVLAIGILADDLAPGERARVFLVEARR